MPGWSKLITVLQLIILILIAMLYTEMARAHARFAIDSVTPPRSDNSGIKTGPCGSDPRSLNPAVFTPGQQITVNWEETINHPGYFRIAFSPANDQGYDNNVLAEIVDTQDDINVPHFYSATITLPDIECNDCSLQLIQYMTERDPPSLYYSCADIRLIADSPPPDVQNVTTASGNNEVSIAWEMPDINDLQVLVLQSNSQITDSPLSGVAYSKGDSIAQAEVLYAGNAGQVITSGLVANQNYYFKIFTVDSEYRYSNGIEVQQTVVQVVNDTQSPASVQNFTATANGDMVDLNWVNPADDFYKVLVLWDTNPIIIDPIDTSRYNTGDMIGTSRVVFNGLGNTATVLDLAGGQTHYFRIYAHDASFNYSQGVDANEFLPAAGINQKPRLNLVASQQNGDPVTTIYQDKGPVTITVMIDDDSDVSQATISWEGTDDRLIDMDTQADSLTIDPMTLPQGNYVVQVEVSDNGNPPLSETASMVFNVVSAVNEDSFGAGSVGHLGLLFFLLLLQRFYSIHTRRG